MDMTFKMTTADFCADFLDESHCRQWILNKLHPGDPRCPGCAAAVPARSLKRFSESARIKCPTCGKFFTCRTETVIAGSHLEFREIVLLAMLLALGLGDKIIAEILKINAESVRLWRKKLM